MNIKIIVRLLHKVTLLGLLALLFTGCNLPAPAQTPVVIYVTPTSEQAVVGATTATTPSDYGSVVGADATLATLLPTFTQGALNTPLPQPSVTGPTPAYGAVIDPQARNTSQPVNPVSSATQSTSSTQQSTGSSTTEGQPTYGSVIGPDYTPPPTFTPVIATPVAPANVTLPPAVTAGPSPTPGPVLRRDLMGIQVHGFLTNEEWDSMLNHIHTLGLGWVKVQVQWRDMEPVKGQYSLQYKTLVLALQRARSPNIRTMVSIAKAPDWARPANARGKEDGPAENPQDLADFVRQLVIDVKPEFLDAVEVWNEPNLIREWRGASITGAEYIRHFDAAYKAVIEAQKMLPSSLRPNHRITVITAGPAPTGTVSGVTLNDRDWLQQLYNSGLANYGDDVAVGAHPYGWANPPEALCCSPASGVTGWYEHPSFYFRNTLDTYRQIMERNGDTSRKIWVTEFGYASYDGLRKSDGSAASVHSASGWQTLIDRNQQADYVLRAFQIAQKPPYYDFLGPFMLWNLNFATIPKLTDDGREEAGFSLLDQEYNPRPVYITLQNAPKQ